MSVWRLREHGYPSRTRQPRHIEIDMTDAHDSGEVFPLRLQAARQARGLSQQELANRAGLPASSISHFEGGGRKPSFDNLRRLANALEVSTDYLLGRVEELQAISGVDMLNRHLGGVDPKVAEAMRRMADLLDQLPPKKPGSNAGGE